MNQSPSALPFPSPEQIQQAIRSPSTLRSLLSSLASQDRPPVRVTWLCPRADFQRCSELALMEGFIMFDAGARRMPRLGEFVDASGDEHKSYLVPCDDEVEAAMFLQTLRCLLELTPQPATTRAILITGSLLADDLVRQAAWELMKRHRELGLMLLLLDNVHQ